MTSIFQTGSSFFTNSKKTKMTYAWIKLYSEILDDPKMGRLPNHLWRRAIELFLLAGRNGNGGVLRPVEEMAWALRSSPDEIRSSLMSLAEIGVVHETPDGWVVTNFAKRQAALTPAERQSRHRAGNSMSRGSHENVTEEDREEDKETEKDIEIVAATLLKHKFPFNPNTGTIISGWKEDFSDDIIVRAIEDAASHGARSLNYVDRIIIGWKANGVPPTREERVSQAKSDRQGKQSPAKNQSVAIAAVLEGATSER